MKFSITIINDNGDKESVVSILYYIEYNFNLKKTL